MDRFEFVGELWLWNGDAAWHFITVPADISDEIEERVGDQRRGFGSARVRVTVRGTTWSTSVFPDSKRQAYVLPVKKDVRRREGLSAGDQVPLSLELVDV